MRKVLLLGMICCLAFLPAIECLGQSARFDFENLLSESARQPMALAFVAHMPDYFMQEDCPPKFNFLNKPLVGGYFQSSEIQERESRFYDLILRDDCKRYFLLSALADYHFLLADSLLAEAKLPAEYKFLMLTQSGINPLYKSGIEAGIWGQTHADAARYGLWAEDDFDERMISEKATHAAVRHLSFLHNQLNGQTHLVVLAFARGMLRIRQAGPEIASSNWVQYLTEDEKEYLAFFSAAVRIRSLLPLNNMRPALVSLQWNYDKIDCDTIISLKRIAEVLKIDAKALAILNAHLPSGMYKPDPGERFIILEKDLIPNFRAKYAEIKKPAPVIVPAPAKEESTITHVVKRGDVLSAIAQRYGVKIADLQAWNGIKRDLIHVGQKLVIYTSKPPAEKEDTSAPNTPAEYTTYTVREGDTLWGIAQKYKNVSPEEIMEMNGIGENIRPGQKLKIPKE